MYLLVDYTRETEKKWQTYWKGKRINQFDFKDKSRPIYTIDTPPPFTSGTLHMGHVLNYTLIDFIARYKRMSGFNVFYPQGWDTQGFPTEKAVEKKYGSKLTRKEFYDKCVKTATGNIEKMKEQMLSLGCSFDERYEYVTMSEDYRAKVQLSLLMMYDKGMIYRGRHPVEWCTKCRSAIAHAETEEINEEGLLVHLLFKSESGKEITIATTRPELLHACVAVAVNPEDKRYSKLIGKSVVTPLFKKSVKVIADAKVEMSFGTGAEMVCTFGDKLDVEMYYRNSLNYIESIGEDGRLRNSGIFDGLKIAEARTAIIGELEKSGAIVKKEKMSHAVKVHDRCGTPIEFIFSMQWFIKLKEYKDRIKALGNEIKWVPEFTKTYLDDWANFIEWDWVISRNRIFGTPIPFWYCESCGAISAPERKDLPVDPSISDMKMVCKKCKSPMTGESATCDVWIDSSITPLVISGWPDNKALMSATYPITIRSLGAGIIRTWAFYTIFRCWALTDNKPIECMVVNGNILAQDGTKMSKSKNNGIAPEDLLKDNTVDTVRLWAALSGAIGKDRPFNYKDVSYAKSSIHKMFNSAAFVKSVVDEVKPKSEPNESLGIFDLWILSRLNSVIKKVTESYEAFNFYEVTNTLLNFYWHEFCDYYIESVKHRVYAEKGVDDGSKEAAGFVLNHVLDSVLLMLAPLIPHVAEEINSTFSKKSVFTRKFPEYTERNAPTDYVINGLVFKSAIVDNDYEEVGALLNAIVADVRKYKASNRIALNKEVTSIDIKVPETYYKAVEYARPEISGICKSQKVSVSKGAYSVNVIV